MPLPIIGKTVNSHFSCYYSNLVFLYLQQFSISESKLTGNKENKVAQNEFQNEKKSESISNGMGIITKCSLGYILQFNAV